MSLTLIDVTRTFAQRLAALVNAGAPPGRARM
jgi:hypothetical protein